MRSITLATIKLIALVLIALVLIALGPALIPAAFAGSTTLVISQVYGGGGNSIAPLTNDFVEILNISSSPVNLLGYSIQYASSTGSFSSSNLTALPNVTLQPGHYFLIQEAAGTGAAASLPAPDFTGSINLSATTGKVALVSGTTAIASCTAASVVDLIGYGSSASCSKTAPAPGLSNTTSALRSTAGCTDTNNNSADFTAGVPNPRNTSSPATSCTAAPPPLTITTSSLPAATVSNIYAATLTATGGSGVRTWSSSALPAGLSLDPATGLLSGIPASAGSISVTFTVTDTSGQSSSALSFTASPIPACSAIPIGAVQGAGDATPIPGQSVVVQGVVTALRSNGFFIQDGGDGNAATADGIFVFTSSTPSGNAVIGNAVCVTGIAAEFNGQTELDSPVFFALSTRNTLPVPHLLTTSDLNPAGPIDQLEKYSGMRVTIPLLTVTGPTGGTVDEVHATATSNGVFYGVIAGTPRPFREPGIALTDTLPPGTPPGVPRWDTNPEVIEIYGPGQVGTAPIDVTAGAAVTGITGVMSYYPSMYEILPDPGSGAASGNITFTSVPDKAANEFTIASANLEHFYNTTQDPNAPPGASSTNVDPQAFANRVSKLSLGFREVLKLPDVIGVEEMLNLATLQTVAAQVNTDAQAQTGINPGYTAYLQEGNDISNINVGFLVKSGITVIDVTQYGKNDLITNPTTGSVSPLNDRPPLVLRAQAVPSGGGSPVSFTVIVNHLRSLDDIDDPVSGPFVRLKRQKQAEYLANLIQSRQMADPAEKIIAIGDFNAYQFNDGYVDVVGTVEGKPAPPGQVVLASSALVNPPLTALVDLENPSQRYSYTFSGSAEEIDQFVVNNPAIAIYSRFAPARLNADFPEAYRGQFNRPERISDHDWVVGYFSFPPNGAPPAPFVYVSDATRVQKFTSNGTFVSEFPINAGGQFAFGPAGMAIDPGGNFWLTDIFNKTVSEFDASGRYINSFGSYGTGNGQFLNGIGGVAVDPAGNVWVVDGGNSRVQEFNASGVYQNQFGIFGSGNGQFEAPVAVAIDNLGEVCVADATRVQKFTSSGAFVSQFPITGDGRFLFGPAGMAVDGSGNFWLTDGFNKSVAEFDVNGRYINSFGSYGTGNGQFSNGIAGIAGDSAGNVQVVDSGNSRVEEFTSSGLYETQFGTFGTANGQFQAAVAVVTATH